MVDAAGRVGIPDPVVHGRDGTWSALAAGAAFVLWGVLVVPPAVRFADSAWGWFAVGALGLAPALLLARLLGAPARDRAEAGEDAGRLEREALAALATHGPSTPAEVALRTSLTIEQASALLDALVSLGAVRVVDGPEGPTCVYDIARATAPNAASFSATGEPDPTAANGHGTAPASMLVDPLSGREMDVLALLATGRPNREIAGVLYVSIGTVKSHTNNIYRKLGARNRTEAIARARELALV